MNNCTRITTVAACAAFASVSGADELRVPQDYATLAAAAVAAMPGDVIVLDQGVFEGQVIFDDFHIRIRGQGAGLTFIVPASNDNGLPLLRWYDNGIDRNAGPEFPTLEDLTLIGFAGGDPSQQASYRQGLSVQGQNVGRFTMQRVRFEEFYVPNQLVCSIVNLDSFEANDCVFANTSGEEGSLEIRQMDQAVLHRCSFERSSGYRGTLTLTSITDATIENCSFVGTASMSLSTVRPSVQLAIVNATIRNCTFGAGGADVTSPSAAAGHFSSFNSAIQLERCAFGDGALFTGNINSTIEFDRCIGLQVPAVNGNIVADPQFVDPGDPGADGVWRTADDNTGDLTPMPTSPMIDAAGGEAFGPGAVDALGNPRLVDVTDIANTGTGPIPYLDIGAIEYQGTNTCIADVNADGVLSPADFTAWIAAFNSGAPACDQNGDRECTPADFTAWIANYNAGCD